MIREKIYILLRLSNIMSWYKFWKKSGPMQGLSKEYLWIDKKLYPDKSVELACARWAEKMPGGHNTHYTYGFREVGSPPREVLEKMIIRESMQIDTRTKHLELLQKTLVDLLEKKPRKKRKKKD
jgi:hypothetical protein